MSDDDLPCAVSSATINLGGFEIEVVQLSDGQRIITEDGLVSFFAFLDGADPDFGLKPSSVIRDPTGETGAPNLPTLAHVLLAIADAEGRLKVATTRFRIANAKGDEREEDRWSDIEAAIDDELSELRDRARAMIEAATGVSWEQIYGALA